MSRTKPRPSQGKDHLWLYGVNPVMEALRAGRGVKAVYIFAGRKRGTEDIDKMATERGVTLKVIEDQGFFDSRFPKGHQGVAAEVAGKKAASLEDILEIPPKKGELPFFVILDLIEDPRNLGAILRSAEAAGVHGVVVQERRSAALGAGAWKASAGALEHIAVVTLPNIKYAIDKMKQLDILIAGAEAGPHPPPWDVRLDGPLAIVVGSEGKGLRRTVAERCDTMVSLPMMGKVNSLNASVAAGIMIYEALRQRVASPKSGRADQIR